jgi:hypothetical protein
MNTFIIPTELNSWEVTMSRKILIPRDSTGFATFEDYAYPECGGRLPKLAGASHGCGSIHGVQRLNPAMKPQEPSA